MANAGQIPGQQPNVMQQSAGAYNNAIGTTQGALGANFYASPQQAQTSTYGAATGQAQGYQPMTGQATGYNAAQGQATGYGAAQAGVNTYDPTSMNAAQGFDVAQVGFNPNIAAQGYDPASAASQGYDAATMDPARNIAADSFANANMSAYMNPYQSAVTDQAISDIERQRQIMANQMAGRQAQAGAFGGSRHGVADSLTNERALDQIARTSADLNFRGYESARDSAFRDIGNNLAAQQANQNADLSVGQFNANSQNRANQFGAAAGNQAALANMAAANQAGQFGASAQNQASMAENQLGADLAARDAAAQNAMLGQQMQNQQAANQYNASAANQAGQFGAAAGNQIGLANQAAQNQAGQFGAAAQNAMTSQNVGALNQAGQFGAAAANDMTLQNLGFTNQAGQFNAGAQNDMTARNMAAQNQAGQFNAGNLTDTSRFNAAEGNRFRQNQFNNALGGASQLGNLSQLGFNMGNEISDRQARDGAISRQLQQQVIDAARQQYGNYTNAGNLGLGPLAQFVGGNYGSTQTQTSNPGILGTIGSGLSMASGLGWAPFG